MQAVNLYTLTRNVSGEIKPIYEKALSGRENVIKIREEEFELMRTLVANFMFYKADKRCYDDWFYSFVIPQIGKEFDLLKIGSNGIVVNIELKSQEVPLEKVKKQLAQNSYYLSHIANKLHCFTYMRSDDNRAKLIGYDKGSLYETTFDELIRKIGEIDQAKQSEIEKMFRPKDYLISPLNTPEKFLLGKYYLSNQQEDIKNKIVSGITNGRGLWGIRGAAGTGKTLLLYDIAKTLAKSKKICLIHCGMLSEGHHYLKMHLDNVSVIDAKSLPINNLLEYDIICVDETQRLYRSGMDIILKAYDEDSIQGCIFSYDYVQALSKAEVRRNNPQRLNAIAEFQEEKLTERIRTNKEIYSFIRNMMRLYDKPHQRIEYPNIDVIYANNIDESDRITGIYREKDYTLISFTPSRYVPNSIDHYSGFSNSHQVIGQEFDNVLIVLDNNFRYSAKGDLEGKEHPNPDYLFPRLFYQNISRAREKLCIVVLQNEALFDTLLRIKENCLEFKTS